MTARRRPSGEEPLEDFVEAVGRVPTQQLKKALVAVYQGLSPMLGSVMASRVSGLTATTKVGDISPEQWSALYSGPWKRWLEIIGDGGCALPAMGATQTTAAVAAHDGAAAAKGDEVLPVSDDGDGSVAESSSSSVSVVSSVPTKPWISEDGASYYPTTLGEEGEEEEENTTGVAVEGGEIDDGASGGGGGSGSSGWGRRLGGLTRLEKVMEAYYRGTQSNEEFDSLKRRCLARVTATLAKLRERAAEFEDQLAAAQEDKVRHLQLCVRCFILLSWRTSAESLLFSSHFPPRFRLSNSRYISSYIRGGLF